MTVERSKRRSLLELTVVVVVVVDYHLRTKTDGKDLTTLPLN